MTLEKVEEPEIYVLPEVNERAEIIANWFQTVGDMVKSADGGSREDTVSDSNEELAKNPGSNGNYFKSSKN